MKLKGKWSLCLSSSLISEDTSLSTLRPTPDEKKKYPRHLSMHHEKELKKKREEKKAEIEKAVAYCFVNNCKVYKAIADLNLKLCKDPRTIDHHFSREVVPGGDVRILTGHEEKTFVKYVINRNWACQGLNDQQVAGVVLSILRVWQKCNQEKKKGVGNWNKYIPLSVNAKHALATKKVLCYFFRRIRAAHLEVKLKSQHKVSLKRGLRCTKEMAIEYLDELARLIEVGITPELKRSAAGVWEGSIDLTWIWAHAETPQFINFSASGQSRKKVYHGSGHDCSKLSKENWESVTVQPFSNFAGELRMVQVIFAGADMTTHMSSENAVEKIPNFLFSVNESGCTTGDTRLQRTTSWVQLLQLRERRREKRMIHMWLLMMDTSRDLMPRCWDIVKNIPWINSFSDTSGATQKHGQINSQLHLKYEEMKSMMYTEYSDLRSVS